MMSSTFRVYQNERQDAIERKVYITWHGNIFGDVRCTRTTTRIRRHADKESKKQEPKTGSQTNLGIFFLVLSLCVRVRLFVCICVSVREAY